MPWLPQGVVRVISALAFHGMTTQIPRQAEVAVRVGTEQPKFNPPDPARSPVGPTPQRRHREPCSRSGGVREFRAAKTAAGCFRFRSRIGIDVVVETLKLYHF